MDNTFRVTNEIGRLKKVLVHRPGQEIENITPGSMERMLYDDVPYLARMQKEHDQFVDLLRDNEVEVVYLADIATESLRDDAVRLAFIEDIIHTSKQAHRRSTDPLRTYLQGLTTKELVDTVLAGVSKKAIKLPATQESKQLHELLEYDVNPFYLNPMPNVLYTRDAAAVIGEGVSLHKMSFPVRKRESLLLQYVLDNHPSYRDQDIKRWFDRSVRFPIEGGDMLVLNSETMMIGLSERTSPEAIEHLAATLFEEAGFKRVIAVSLPKRRSYLHLDTALGMINSNTFVIDPRIQGRGGRTNLYILEKTPYSEHPKVTLEDDLEHALRVALSQPKINLVKVGNGDPIAMAREQWNGAANVLTIAPNVVVSYERNHVTNKALRAAGVTVLETPGAELGSGHGGPRCMTMPLVREDILANR